jgi:hypothetical protein
MSKYSLPREQYFLYVAYAILFSCLAVGLHLRWLYFDDFIFPFFTDRDFFRAITLWEEFQFTGAEIGDRIARTPGGMLYYFINFLQQINPDVRFIYAVVIIMDCVVLLAIPFLFFQHIGWTASLFTAALYGVAPPVLSNIWTLWNPSFALPYGVLFYWFLLSHKGVETKYPLPLAIACAAIGGQFHGTFFLLIGVAVLYVLLMRTKVSGKILLGCLGALVIPLSPYIIFEVFTSSGDFTILGQRYPQQVGGPGNFHISIGHTLVGLSSITGGSFNDIINGGLKGHSLTLPELVSSNLLFYLSTTALLNLGIAVIGLATIRVGYNFIRSKRKMTSTTTGILLLFLMAFIYTSVFTFNSTGRYILFLLLPGLLLAGIAYQELANTSSKYWGRITTICLAALLLGRYALITFYHDRKLPSIESYDINEKLVRFLKNDFGFNISDIQSKIAVLSQTKDGLVFKQKDLPLIYLTKIIDKPLVQQRYNGCVLLLANDYRSKSAPNPSIKDIVEHLPYSRGFRIERSIVIDDWRILGYRTSLPSCIHNGANGYILTPRERLLDETAANLLSGKVEKITLGKLRTAFVTVIDAGYPIALMVELSQEENRITAEIHGNSMRGMPQSFRIQRGFIKDIKIRFTLEETQTTVAVMNAPGTLGSNGLYTPWIIGREELPSGTYSVDLSHGGLTAAFFEGVNHGEAPPALIRLTDKFDVLEDP